MKKTANLQRGRKRGSYDVIPVCVRMRKGPNLELWNSTINILRVLLLTQNIKFTASWVRRVYSEVVLPVLHMSAILLLRSKTAEHCQFCFQGPLYSPQWVQLGQKVQKLNRNFLFVLFFLFLWRFSGQRLCVQVKFLWRLFALDGDNLPNTVCGCAADNKLEVEHCPFVPPYEQY